MALDWAHDAPPLLEQNRVTTADLPASFWPRHERVHPVSFLEDFEVVQSWGWTKCSQKYWERHALIYGTSPDPRTRCTHGR